MLDLTQFEGHTPGPWAHPENIFTMLQLADPRTGFEDIFKQADTKDILLCAAAPDLLAEVKANRERLQGLETYAKNVLELLDEARESVAFELGWYVEDEPRPRYKAQRERLKDLLEKIDKEIEGVR